MARVQDVARFFIKLGQEQAENNSGDLVTNLRLQKMLYFAQGWYMARYGKTLFDAEFQAWEFGPVVPAIYHKYKVNGSTGISDHEELSEGVFTEEEMALLIEAASEFDNYATSKLVEKSHSTTPWLNARSGRGNVIRNDDILAYFENNKLPSLDEIIAQLVDEGKIEEVTPRINADGCAVFPAEIAEGWENGD